MIAGILLDTCAAMYIVDQEWMQPDALRVLGDALDRGDTVWVSPITGWEIGILASKNRFKSRYKPRRWLETLLAQPQVGIAELTAQVLLESSLLPGSIHGDPADRILAATAREYGYTLMTRDSALLAYACDGHLSALAC